MRRRLTLYRAVGRKGGKAFDVDIVVNRPDRFWVAVRRLGGQAGDSLRWSINIGFVSRLPAGPCSPCPRLKPRLGYLSLKRRYCRHRFAFVRRSAGPPVRRSACPPVRPPARPPSAYPHLPHPHCAQV